MDKSIIDSTVYLLANRSGSMRESFSELMALVQSIDPSITEQMAELFRQTIADITEKAQPLYEIGENLLNNLPLLIFTPKNQLVDQIGPEAAQLVEEFCNTVPYYVCAALLLLEFDQSLELYDETLVVAMLKAAIFRLTWQIPNILFDYRMTPHPVQPDYTPMPVEPMKFGTNCPVPDCDKNVPLFERLNLSQLVYLATGMTLPRTFEVSPDFIVYLQGLGVPETTAYLIAGIAIAAGRSGIYALNQYFEWKQQNGF